MSVSQGEFYEIPLPSPIPPTFTKVGLFRSKNSKKLINYARRGIGVWGIKIKKLSGIRRKRGPF